MNSKSIPYSEGECVEFTSNTLLQCHLGHPMPFAPQLLSGSPKVTSAVFGCGAPPLPGARSIWAGDGRPTPAEIRRASYDVEAGTLPAQKLLICAAPRTSSKRLARLLLAAGIGVPMEYFNLNSIKALTARWGIKTREYLKALYMRRSANGVFSSNLQHQQIRDWPHPCDIDDLFDHASVIHLVRPDKAAQAASLAACLLTGRWGFEEVETEHVYAEKRLRNAACRALRLIEEEDRLWGRLFEVRGITPIIFSTEQVNRDDLTLVTEIAEHLRVQVDLSSLKKMLRCDRGRYSADMTLKSKLRALIENDR